MRNHKNYLLGHPSHKNRLHRHIVKRPIPEIPWIPDAEWKSILDRGRDVLRGVQSVKFFTENVSHYSGGRYYAYMVARVMAMYGFDVEVVTNNLPFFVADFENYPVTGSFTIKEDPFWGQRDTDRCKADLIIGVPNRGGQYAHAYARVHGLPYAGMIFETPNYVKEWHGGLDSTEEYWRHYRTCLLDASLIICLADEPMRYAQEWLPEKPADTFVALNPAVNEFVAALVPDQRKDHSIIFIGRHTDFKQPYHLIYALEKIEGEKPLVRFVGMWGERMREKIASEAEKINVPISFHRNIPDREKFRLLKKSKVLVTATRFEGFGIPPAEALWCGVPAVAYDLPVLRGAYEGYIDLVPIDNWGAMGEAINNLLKNPSLWKKRSEEGKVFAREQYSLHRMGRDMISFFSPPKRSSVSLSSPKEVMVEPLPSLSVGTIVLNGASTIQYSLASIYDVAKEILIVEGAVEKYAEYNPDMVSREGGSVDDTLDVIESFPDPDNKIKILAAGRLWRDKPEMQNMIAKAITGDVFLKVDSDEVYKRRDLQRILREFEVDSALTLFNYRFWHFWHTLDQIAVGGQWDSPMARCWRWRPGFHYGTSFNFLLDDRGRKVETPLYKKIITSDRLVYHLNYAGQPGDLVRAKLNYYANRGIETNVKDTWSDWQPGQGDISPTHGGGRIVQFSGLLPPELGELAERLETKEVSV